MCGGQLVCDACQYALFNLRVRGLFEDESKYARSPDTHRDGQQTDNCDDDADGATDERKPDVDQRESEHDAQHTTETTLQKINQAVHHNLLNF